MNLTRNLTEDGSCKYALVRLDKLRKLPPQVQKSIADSLLDLQSHGLLEYGKKGDKEEFFVLKLKDAFAPAALRALRDEVVKHAPVTRLIDEGVANRTAARQWAEYAADLNELVGRCYSNPDRKFPDTEQPLTPLEATVAKIPPAPRAPGFEVDTTKPLPKDLNLHVSEKIIVGQNPEDRPPEEVPKTEPCCPHCGRTNGKHFSDCHHWKREVES